MAKQHTPHFLDVATKKTWDMDYPYKSSGSPWETEKNFKFEYASKQVVQVIFLAQYFKKSGFTKNIYATIMK